MFIQLKTFLKNIKRQLYIGMDNKKVLKSKIRTPCLKAAGRQACLIFINLSFTI